MMETRGKERFPGCVNTVLTYGRGEDVANEISSIIARVCEESNERIRFSKRDCFHEETITRAREIILPVVDRILSSLEIPQMCFEISLVGLNGSHSANGDQKTYRLSDDFPIFLALLSTRLEMFVPENIVPVGQIISSEGNIQITRGLPDRFEMPGEQNSIPILVHPDVYQFFPDKLLPPDQKQKIEDALIRARRTFRTVAIQDICELLETVFSDEQVVLASLKNGFFQHSFSLPGEKDSCEKAARFFGENNERRFWHVFQSKVFSGQTDDSRRLLQELARFHIARKSYIKRLGAQLANLLQTLPAETRRKIDFPLLDMPECILLSQFADKTDYNDVRLLFSAAFGEGIQPSTGTKKKSTSGTSRAEEDNIDKLLSIHSKIDPDVLAALISKPLDTARETYVLKSLTAASSDELRDTITSFYVHMMVQTERIFKPIDPGAAAAEAFALLERAFSDKGGFRAAVSEGLNPANGGQRLILDLMTEQFKREETEKHVNFVLKSLDLMDWGDKVGISEALLNLLDNHLSSEIRSEPPARFADHVAIISKSYVQSLQHVKTLFRSL